MHNSTLIKTIFLVLGNIYNTRQLGFQSGPAQFRTGPAKIEIPANRYYMQHKVIWNLIQTSRKYNMSTS